MADEAPNFLLRAAAYNRRCDIFLSSGSDIFAERDRFVHLADVINHQLFQVFSESSPVVQLNIVRWEQAAPHKTGGDPNAEFRRQARRAHVTVVLLHDDIRPGTLDELEAALDEPDVQVAVIWMEQEHPRTRKALELRKYLQSKKDIIIWDQTGAPGSDEACLSMVRILTKAAFEVLRETIGGVGAEGMHYESP